MRKFIEGGKKIIVTTIQKFPFILDEIGTEHRNRPFAIVIDEAHSSQGGRTMAKMHAALSKEKEDEEETYEDRVNAIMESRKLLPNASYFAFTATPKNKTLELFGEAFDEDGTVCRITLNRPDVRNALSIRLSDELTHALERVRDSSTIKVAFFAALAARSAQETTSARCVNGGQRKPSCAASAATSTWRTPWKHSTRSRSPQ